MEKVKCLILGGGPAGYTAAIYAARLQLSPVLYEGAEPGGQLTATTLVENYPGFEQGVDPLELTGSMRAQAKRFGTDIRSGSAVDADFSKRPLTVTLDTGVTLAADSVIIATGATARWLNLSSEQKYRGMGVSACATCDGFFFRGRDVAVAGGGDTACEDAYYLSRLCRSVRMIVRRDVLRASEAMQAKVLSAPNVEILWNCNVVEVLGDGTGMTGLKIGRKDGTFFDIAVDGLFVAIGHHPASEVFSRWVRTDSEGYIITEGKTSRTSVEGVFAAGDVQDPRYRQAITAAASGCRAALDVKEFLCE